MRVLVLEDNALIAMLLHMMVSDAGHEPMGPVSTVEEAFGLIDHDGLPDVAVLDVDLGDHDSTPVYEKMAAEGIPAMMLTGHGEHARQLGFDHATIIDKPVESDDFEAALAKLIREYESSPDSAYQS